MPEIFETPASVESPNYFNREVTADELRKLLQESLDSLPQRLAHDEPHVRDGVQAVYRRVLNDKDEFAYYLREWNRLNATDNDWDAHYQIDGD